MAFLSKPASLIFVTAMCFLFVVQLQPSDCSMESGCFYIQAAPHKMYNRKLLSVLEDYKMVFKNEAGTGGKGMHVGGGWELREAPLGPDPLHHHGGSPRKPETP